MWFWRHCTALWVYQLIGCDTLTVRMSLLIFRLGKLRYMKSRTTDRESLWRVCVCACWRVCVCVHVYISMRACTLWCTCRNCGEGEGEKGVTGLELATNMSRESRLVLYQIVYCGTGMYSYKLARLSLGFVWMWMTTILAVDSTVILRLIHWQGLLSSCLWSLLHRY